MCLDVLRALERTPNAIELLSAELRGGKDARVKHFAERLEKRVAARERNDESQARALVRELVLALQAVLLIKHAPASVADAFCASRLEDGSGSAFGLLRSGLDLRKIAERAMPAG